MRKLALSALAAMVTGTGGLSAQMVFARTLIEVEAAPDAEVVEVEFPFEVGEQGASIAEYDAPCSCLEAKISGGGKLQWEPGEKGAVQGVFKLGNFRGTVDKVIVLRMKGEAVPSVKLTVRVDIPELVSIEPRTLFWNQGGLPDPRSIRITLAGEKPVKIVKTSGTNEQFPFELKEVEPGRTYDLVVTPTTVETRAFGLIRLQTDSQYPRHKQYQCFVVIRNEPPVAK